MAKQNLASILVLALGLLLGAGALVSHARQGEEKQGEAMVLSKVASVDLDRLYRASDAPQIVDRQFIEFEMELQSRLNDIVERTFLDFNELQEYVNLLGKPTPEQADRDRIQALRQISSQRQANMRQLQAKPEKELTPEEKKTILSTTERVRLFQTQWLPILRREYESLAAARRNEAQRLQEERLREIVRQIAKDKGFTHVFDSGTLVYSVHDLTPIALPKVTKKSGNK